MIVCVCHRISDRDIAAAARSGCTSFAQLQDETLVATACGACKDCACETFEARCAQGPSRLAAEWSCIDFPSGGRHAPQAAPVQSAGSSA